MNSVGIGTRVLNFVVDVIPTLLLAYTGYRTWEWYSFYFHITYYPFIYFWVAATFIYYLFFEGIWRRTPGKWMSLSKVAAADGKKASLGQILVRCIIRVLGMIIIDALFLPIVGRTAHDYVSKTYVIEV